MSGRKRHMDVFLREIFKQFIAIKDADYKKAQEVYNSVIEQIRQKMGERDNFFAQYSSQAMIAGSVYDGIKVGKLDEFDLDIVIRLPISYDDGENGIIIENHKPGFVKMKIINAFDNLDKQPNWEQRHKVTRDWRDSEKYLLQNKFRYWMHSTVQKAVNDLGGRVIVNDVPYLLKYTESGPGYTLNIKNDGGEPFVLDVDLVPVIRFMLPRWPEGYRSVESSQVKEWLVVPKPLKNVTNCIVKHRCWRLSFHEFEREIIKGCELLKFTIRLVKKLRDSLGLTEIASYYIKTLFLWEIEERQDKKYWQNKVSVLFTDMVRKLLHAVESKEIPYYWHKDHNLIETLKPTLANEYAKKLKGFLVRLDKNDIDAVITYLLTPDELKEFENTEFYKSYPPYETIVESSNLIYVRQNSNSSTSCFDGPTAKTENDSTKQIMLDILASNKRLESKTESLIKKIENKVDKLGEKVDKLYVILKRANIIVPNEIDNSDVTIIDSSNFSKTEDVSSSTDVQKPKKFVDMSDEDLLALGVDKTLG